MIKRLCKYMHRRLTPGEKGSAFFAKGMQPAARKILSAFSEENLHSQAELCFLRRTCRRRKRIQPHLRPRRKLCEAFYILKRLCKYMHRR